MNSVTAGNRLSERMLQTITERAGRRFELQVRRVSAQVDRIFAVLMVIQWLAEIGIALIVTPRTWIGATSNIHTHVYTAIVIGGAISLPSLYLAIVQPGAWINRYVIGAAQVLHSTLLIHLTGGRIETHFHVFGSLAFLALYRDWRVLILPTAIVAVDHLVRGLFWPQSVFGTALTSNWRWAEHAGWVLFEDAVLITACRQSRREMLEMSRQWSRLSVTKELVEEEVKRKMDALNDTEKQLWDAGLRMRGIIETTCDAFISFRENGTIVQWSPRAEQAFGWSADDVVGRNIREILGLSELLARFSESMNSHELAAGIRLETIARHRDGSMIPVEASASLMRYEDDAGSINVFLHDITKRREMQSQLLLSQKMQGVGQLAAGIAHEINTPTQYVGDNLRFLADSFQEIDGLLAQLEGKAVEEPLTPEEWRTLQSSAAQADLSYLREEFPRAAEQALDGIERITQITRAMKEFSHPGTVELQLVDLPRLIDNSTTVCRNEWKYVAELVTDYDPALPPLMCLPGELSQVIVNLVVNAAQAIVERTGGNADQRGEIVIQTRDRGELAEISIRDNGPGIPPEILPRIFEPFFTTKEVGKGTGQGLAIAHSVVAEKHKGTISVSSVVGQGTTFILRLPQTGSTSNHEAKHEASPVC